MVEISVRPERVRNFLFAVIVLLTLAHIASRLSAAHFGQSFPLLDLDDEGNIPSLFSALCMVVCAALFLLITYAKYLQRERHQFHWAILALVFLFFAVDEAVELHERITTVLRPALHTTGLLYSAWILPYGLFAILLGVFYIRFLLRLPKRVRLLFVAAGVIYITGAAGFEALGESLSEQSREASFAFQLFVVLEEFLEMIGIALLIYGTLTYIATDMREVRFHFVDPDFPADVLSKDNVLHIGKRGGFREAGKR